MITATRLNSPRLAVKPANGRMISLGSGGNTFSSAIAMAAPTTPSRSIMSTAQPATPVVGSPDEARMSELCIGTEVSCVG